MDETRNKSMKIMHGAIKRTSKRIKKIFQILQNRIQPDVQIHLQKQVKIEAHDKIVIDECPQIEELINIRLNLKNELQVNLYKYEREYNRINGNDKIKGILNYVNNNDFSDFKSIMDHYQQLFYDTIDL